MRRRPVAGPERLRTVTTAGDGDGGEGQRPGAGQRGTARPPTVRSPTPGRARRPGRRPSPMPTSVPTSSGTASSSTALAPMPSGRHPADEQQPDLAAPSLEPQRGGGGDEPGPGQRGERGDRPRAPADRGLDGPAAAGDERQVGLEPTLEDVGGLLRLDRFAAHRPARRRRSGRPPAWWRPHTTPAPRVTDPTRQIVDQPVDVGDGDVLAQPRLPPARDPLDPQLVHQRGQRDVVDEQDRRRQVELTATGQEHVGVRAPRAVVHVGTGAIAVDAGDGQLDPVDRGQVPDVEPGCCGRPGR